MLCERKRGCEGSFERVTKRKGARDSGCTEKSGKGGEREEVRVKRKREKARARRGGVAENERVIRLIFQHREILPLNH